MNQQPPTDVDAPAGAPAQEAGRPISGPFPEVSGDATPVEIQTPAPRLPRLAIPGPETGPVDVEAHTHLGMPLTPPPVMVPLEPGSGPLKHDSAPLDPHDLDPGPYLTPEPPPEHRERPTRELAIAASPEGHSDEVSTAVLRHRKPPADLSEGPLSGSLFEGKYKVGPLLGEGGMGQVYLATHVMMRKDVALKILHPTMGLRPEIVERFRREAESAARLTHRNIISVLDFGRATDSTFYLVMEFVEGESLSRAMIGGAMNWRRVCRLGIQMLSALEEAHKAGVVHRDLKPDNIMIQLDAGGEEHLKILDFGIAKLAESEGGVQVTQAGMIFGTPSYISPEQAQGKNVTHKADLYAMGVILFQMLTGRLPFEAPSPIDLLGKHIHEAPPRVRSLVPELPPALEMLILKTMSKKPDDRPQDAFEMRTVLGRLLEMDSYRKTMSVPIRARMDDFLTSRAGKALFGLIALALLGGVLYFIFSPLLKSPSGRSDLARTGDAMNASDGGDPKNTGDPTGPSGPKSAAMILLESGKLEEALKTAQDALTANPGSEVASAELRQVRTAVVAEGKKTFSDEMIMVTDMRVFEEKVVLLRKWIGWFPQDGELQFLLALTYARGKDLRKSIDLMSKALMLDPTLKKHKAVPSYINRNLLSSTHWIRYNTLKLIMENFGQDKPEDLKFLLTALNDDKFDADHRYDLYQWLKSHGVTEGITEESFWMSQLRWSVSCKNRLEASNWFSQNGHRGHVDFLKFEAGKKVFPMGTGRNMSTSCYRKQLAEAVEACQKRPAAP